MTSQRINEFFFVRVISWIEINYFIGEAQGQANV